LNKNAANEETSDNSLPQTEIQTVIPQSGDVQSAEVESNDETLLLKPVGEATRNRLAPTVEQRYFPGRPPLAYLRHRIVEVDADRLLPLLQESYAAWLGDGSERPVTITLFPDKSFDIILERWVEHDSGSRFLFGRKLNDPAGQTHFKLSITHNGDIMGALGTSTHSYRLESFGHYPYAVVFEYDMSVHVPFD
jgi:hypothetical protein